MKAKTKLPSRLSASLNDEVITHFFESLNSPRSLSCYLLYKYKEFDQLVSLDINPKDYNDPYSFRDDYLATNFLLKNRFLKTSFDVEKRALEKFWDSETKCLETNRRWKSRREFSPYDWNKISLISNKIFSILGPSPNIERMADLSSWGPGASLSIKRRDASSFKKFHDERGITVDAYWVSELIPVAYPGLKPRMFQYELGDSVVVVPKNSKIGRVILLQPGWNLWFQKGLGKLIRSKLRSKGLDLDVSDKRNAELIRPASKTGHLCSVDFSSASDQIAIEPLRELLPSRWFSVLDLFRSKRSADGVHTWNKFSSMGNGFTFELESLIFYALALVACDLSSCTSDEVSVFGDDVVLPREALSSFHYLSDLLGFTINPQKTFSDGYFRESCGAHYFNGVNCKPVFFKEKISDPHSAYRTYNQLRILSHSCEVLPHCDLRFEAVCSTIRRSIRSFDRRYDVRIPYGYGEVGFISNLDEATPSRAKHGFEGYLFLAFSDIPFAYETEEPSLLQVRLTEHSDRPRHNLVEIKSRTKKRFLRILAHEWYNLGPWLDTRS